MRLRTMTVWAAGLVRLCGLATAEACTSIFIKTADGLPFYARTMEYAQQRHGSVFTVPKGTAFTGTLPDGSARSPSVQQ